MESQTNLLSLGHKILADLATKEMRSGEPQLSGMLLPSCLMLLGPDLYCAKFRPLGGDGAAVLMNALN